MLTPAADHVIVALDCSPKTALSLADALKDRAQWVKVGMELFYGAGSQTVTALKARGLKVFLDLKLYDIPNTVHNAARELAKLGVDMITVHASGGPKMIDAARQGLAEGASQVGRPQPKLLAVTVLTSMDQDTLEACGIDRPLAYQAALLARMAVEAGADGIVCSPLEAHAMRTLLGSDALIVTPGVRPAGSATQDQFRISTPAKAITAGSSHLVIGRPITQAPDPIAAFDSIIAEVADALK